MTTERIDLGDVELFVRRLGDPGQPPLLVVHGGPSWDHSYLLPAAGDLADIRHVVLVDLRGCGRSSGGLPIEAYRHDLAAADLSHLITALDLGPVDLLGFSYGGALALRLAQSHPEQLRSLIFASATAYGDFELPPDRATEHDRRLGPDADAVPFGDPALDDTTRTREAALRDAPIHIWNLDLLPEWRSVLEKVRFTGDWLAPFGQGLLGPARPEDPDGILRRAGKPILILHGAKDMGFPVECAVRLHAAVPSELAVIENAAHMAHFEKRAEWVGRLRRFLGGMAESA
ncbi:MAG TPA: alpha/beta hydrolase [Mycobacteriales bacterium]|nr:alpha/beta hydrolase [Mycobacteriales bacterium]